jgi:hypothetical protein
VAPSAHVSTGPSLINGSLPGAVVLFVITAIAVSPAVIGPATRRIAFRADHAGITLSADPHDSWPLRPGHAAGAHLPGDGE